MNKKISTLFLILVLNLIEAQKENNIWYFGNHAGLDFSTNPPTTLTNSAMFSSEGCSSVCDQNGSLLFYTDGIKVWNKAHLLMANGTGLMGHPSAAQSGLVVKQPANTNIYYLFTVDVAGGTNGLRYSTIDMNLAAGMGSVTTKNILVYAPSTEKLTAVRTSNGLDVWVVTHEWGSANFRANKLTATGLNTLSIISAAGITHSVGNIQNAVGCMKISPDGKKLGLAISNTPYNVVELFDFNTSTGIVSNAITLSSAQGFMYGVEFSANSSKFYATDIHQAGYIHQWDIGNNNNMAISNSHTYIAIAQPESFYGMQLAANGKIYVVGHLSNSLSVINNPDFYGSSCGFTLAGQSLGNSNAEIGLPSFLSMPYKVNNFSFQMENPNCSGKIFFHVPYTPTQLFSNSLANNYSITSVDWNFGENNSSSNTSTLFNTSHMYANSGNYTVQLIINFSQGVKSDTLTQKIVINHPKPEIKLFSNSPICENESLNFSILTSSILSGFFWSGPGGLSSTSLSNTIITANTNLTGKYKIHGIYGTICPVDDSVDLIVSAVPKLTLQNATVCLNQKVDLIPSGAIYYKWNCPNGDSSIKNSMSYDAIQFSNSGNYSLTGISQYGCISHTSMNLYISPLPNLDIKILPSQQICLKEVITFITPSNYASEWHGPYYFYCNKDEISFQAATTEQSGNYTLTLRNDLGCKSQTLVPIIINPLPEIMVSGIKAPECPPVLINFDVLNKNENLKVDWFLENQKITASVLNYKFENSGSYLIKEQIQFKDTKCVNTATYLVTALPKPNSEFYFTPASPTEKIDEVVFNNPSKNDYNTTYNWSINNNTNFTETKTPKYTFETAGTYVIALQTKNAYGCIDTVIKKIKVSGDVNVYSPNVFTPNGDNINETFSPVVSNANPKKLLVFNRWGNKIFESNPNQFSWNGTENNIECKEDIYYWKFEYQTENGKNKTISGEVLLLK